MLTMRITMAAAIVALLPALVAAQTDPRAELRGAVSEQVSILLRDGSDGLVKKLSTARVGKPISQTWNVARAKSLVFGRLSTRDAPDCLATSTPAKEPSMALCTMESGNSEDNNSEYRMLAFSRNIGAGEIQFSRRDRFTGELPKPLEISDAQAYEAALRFLEGLGVAREEIPSPPQGAPLPVRTMTAGSADERGGNKTSLALQKVVSLPRAFFVPGGLVTIGNFTLFHVIAPGGALVASDARGVAFAQVDGWSDPQMDFRGKPKATADLINEITDDLWGEGVRKATTLSVLIALRKAYPNPDDPNPPLCPVCGVLRPALQVIVSHVGKGRVESSEKAWVAPGVVREYDLLDSQFQEDRFAPR